jgi:ATP-dependent helicase HrpB
MISLPVDEFIPSILSSLQKNSSLVVSAEPGAGKTTRIPPACVSVIQKKIIVLQPRRLAAKSSAERIAEEQHWSLGSEVGYTVRFENISNSNTKILFLTEALLTRRLLSDPLLSDVGLVIFDEFHERSIHSDVALGLIRELQALERPDLKIIVMSATIDTKAVSNFLENCPIFLVPGKVNPIETIYDNKTQSLNTDFNFIKKV